MGASAGIGGIGTLVTLSALSAAAQTPVPHAVAAPAIDIESGILRLPDPAASATVSAAALIPVRFGTDSSGRSVATIAFDVERSGNLTLALLAPSAASWRVLAAPAPDELRVVDQGGFRSTRTLGFAGELLPGWVIDRRDLRGAPAGPWEIRVETTPAAADERAWLFLSSDPALQAKAYVATRRLVAGEEIAILARVEAPEPAEVDRALVEFEGAAGRVALAMHDDGRHQDRRPDDGWFGAFVPADQVGSVFARVDLGGTLPGGSRFQRSVPLAFEVVLPSLALDGSADARLLGGKLAIEVGASVIGDPRRIHASAEVWGRDETGAEIPVCWISRIDEPAVSGGSARVPLELDLRWLDVARAHAPLELRALRLQDPDTENVLDALEIVPLDAPRLPPPGPPREISRDMLNGVDPEAGGPLGLAWKRSLMLVHGYCSSGSIWPAADFTQPKLEFLDPNANRTHDQFAQLLLQRAQASQLTSFGIVGHSQGGPAALHLLTYYASGLDLSFAGRRIQSVASPYQGTPLASLGFFACGVNNNMTPSGATTWLAGIPSWARAEVFTWTTSNSGSACNVFTGLLLTDPEDGTVEKFRSELPGGNNMGHVTGWCHTTGMSNPASYTDHARNLSMNGAAAR